VPDRCLREYWPFQKDFPLIKAAPTIVDSRKMSEFRNKEMGSVLNSQEL